MLAGLLPTLLPPELGLKGRQGRREQEGQQQPSSASLAGAGPVEGAPGSGTVLKEQVPGRPRQRGAKPRRPCPRGWGHPPSRGRDPYRVYPEFSEDRSGAAALPASTDQADHGAPSCADHLLSLTTTWRTVAKLWGWGAGEDYRRQ